MENFDGEVQDNKYIVANTVDILEKLYRDDLIDRGERESLENCDVIAFTGVKIK
jgi:cyanophycinase-like exopeptidase